MFSLQESPNDPEVMRWEGKLVDLDVKLFDLIVWHVVIGEFFQIFSQPGELEVFWWIKRVVDFIGPSKFGKVVPYVERLMIEAGVFKIDKCDFVGVFSVNDIAQQEVIVTEDDWAVQFL